MVEFPKPVGRLAASLQGAASAALLCYGGSYFLQWLLPPVTVTLPPFMLRTPHGGFAALSAMLGVMVYVLCASRDDRPSPYYRVFFSISLGMTTFLIWTVLFIWLGSIRSFQPPSAALLGALSCYVGLAVRFRRRMPPFPEGHCQTCQYNLTGNESGICPECGTPSGGKAG